MKGDKMTTAKMNNKQPSCPLFKEFKKCQSIRTKMREYQRKMVNKYFENDVGDILAKTLDGIRECVGANTDTTQEYRDRITEILNNQKKIMNDYEQFANLISAQDKLKRAIHLRLRLSRRVIKELDNRLIKSKRKKRGGQ